MSKKLKKVMGIRDDPEAQFEKDLMYIAPKFGCEYVKIEDTKSINASNRKTHREKKRPFDGVMYSPLGNWCVECKMDSESLMAHQTYHHIVCNKISGMFVILRKKRLKKGVKYQIELKQGTWRTDDIRDIFRLLNGDIPLDKEKEKTKSDKGENK